MSDTIVAAIITGVISLIVGFTSGYTYCLKSQKKVCSKSQK